jgi:ubiquinone/menaquinone biosynthesis C-methylase UbiE
MPNPFATASMAAGYAQSRPPLHSRILDRAFTLHKPENPLHIVLDVGCGSGLSTKPLQDVAHRVIGIEPVEEMLTWANRVAPTAHFAAARTEALPILSRTVDLVTAAGSLNYCHLDAAFPELARVLSPSGALCVYDFSQGRKFRESMLLEKWFAEFANRYPMPAAEATPLSPETLDRIAGGFRVVAHEYFEIGLPMDETAYTNYITTETNIASAIRRGAAEGEIRNWLHLSLSSVFGGATHEVLFPGYVAWMRVITE